MNGLLKSVTTSHTLHSDTFSLTCQNVSPDQVSVSIILQ